MKINTIEELLSKYSLSKLATISGVSVAFLRELRAGKIPDHITIRDGGYVAACSVLEKQISKSVENYKTKLREVA